MSMSERMRFFAAVVELGSMTAAAKYLKCGKAYVSQQISRLEQELSTQLLHRTTRKIIVTEAGRVFYGYCTTLVESIANARLAMDDFGNELTGQVKISAPRTLGERQLLPLIQQIMTDYPGLLLTLDLTNEILDLKSHGYDLSLRICEHPPEDMVAKPLGILKEVVCAAPTFLEQIQSPSQPSDLNELACLTLSPPSRRARSWLFFDAERVIEVDIEPKFYCNSYPALLEMAICGKGIVQIPRYLAKKALASGQLLPLLENFETRGDALYLIYPVMANRPAKVQLVIRHLCTFFQEYF